MNHALLINKRRSLKIGLAAIFFLITGTMTVSAQEGISTVDIAGIDTSTFPDVTVQVRLLNSEGLAVSIIPSDALSVTENGDPVNFEFCTAVGFLDSFTPELVEGRAG